MSNVVCSDKIILSMTAKDIYGNLINKKNIVSFNQHIKNNKKNTISTNLNNVYKDRVPQGILKGQFGIFSTGNIAKNVFVCNYYGYKYNINCNQNKLVQRNDLFEIIDETNNTDLIIVPQRDCIAKYINDPSHGKYKCLHKENIKPVIVRQNNYYLILFFTTKNIPANTELLWYYGDNWWSQAVSNNFKLF